MYLITTRDVGELNSRFVIQRLAWEHRFFFHEDNIYMLRFHQPSTITSSKIMFSMKLV